MSEITVNIETGKLRDRVQENRDNHRAVFERAMGGYRKTVITWFETQMDFALDGRGFETYFSMPQPVDHTEDYDRVLDMLSMTEDATIPLSSKDFATYVRDDWGWKKEFTATASNYVVGD